jgi:REP-associated tyrosine transposase
MARQRRIEFEGGLYHVISRGIERREIFRDDADRERYLANLARAVERFKFRLLAYCLMGNHVHLALETGRFPLSRIMRSVNTSYAGYFNVRHRRSGYLFQGRYKAFLVDHDSYLLSLIRYIHENPVNAGMAENAESYRWSSHRSYLGKSPNWLSCGDVLAHFGRKRSVAVKNFKDFFRRAEMEQDSYGLATHYAQVVVGEESFARSAFESIGSESPFAVKALTPRDLVEWIAKKERVKSTELSGRSQSRNLSRIRRLVGYLAPHVGLSLASVARELGRSGSGLWRNVETMTRALEGDDRLHKNLAKIQRDLADFANHA